MNDLEEKIRQLEQDKAELVEVLEHMHKIEIVSKFRKDEKVPPYQVHQAMSPYCPTCAIIAKHRGNV